MTAISKAFLIVAGYALSIAALSFGFAYQDLAIAPSASLAFSHIAESFCWLTLALCGCAVASEGARVLLDS